MKILIALLLALPLAAQAPPAGGQASNPPENQQAQPGAAAASSGADAQQAAQAPARDALGAALADAGVTGAVDIGYRWVIDRNGDLNTYRSIVNLEEGFRVFGLDLVVTPTPNRLVDRIDVNASNWGDPYNTLRIYAQKAGVYRFSWNYLNTNYFNFLPSFADPSAVFGTFLNQRGFDTTIRNNNLMLELFPGKHIVPYVAYDRNSFGGTGTTNLVLQSNEYTFPTSYSDFTNTYRGGVRFEYERWGLTLEQGEYNFHDAQQLPLTATFTGAPTGTNFGNLTTTFLGQRLFLNSGDQSYGVRVRGYFSRGMFSAQPVSWASLYAQFVFNQATNEAHFGQLATGNIVNLANLVFYNTAAQVVNASAKQPHPAGSFGADIRPWKRIRILEALSADHLHDSTGAVTANTFLLTGQPPLVTNTFSPQEYVVTYNRQEANILFDVTNWFTLRGGWRYEWGKIEAPPGIAVATVETTERANLNRNVALAGFVARAGRKVRVNADFEGSAGNNVFFRTSLYSYQKGRVQVRYEPIQTLTLTGNFNILNNDNPFPATYKFRYWDASASLYWTPRESRYTFMAEYSRPSYSSTIQFFAPSTLTPALSIYNMQGHEATALVDVAVLPGKSPIQPRISAGGSMYLSSGTRPERYYQPLGRAMIPFGKHVQWYGEWRWYGYHESLFDIEGFRSHQLITGLRFLM